MNIAIAKNRMNSVVNMDIITSSEADFLATHVALETIRIHSDRYDGKPEAILNEEQVYDRYISHPGDNHQFLLVMGEPGTGKSHLIRWFAAKFRQDALDNEVILFIRRNDNTLKGTLRQLLDLSEVENIPNKEVYDRLVNAAATIDNRKLRFKIYQEFITEIESDDENEILSNTEKRRLIAFLSDEDVKSRLMSEGYAIDRIYKKVAEGEDISDRDVVPRFEKADFTVDIDFGVKLIAQGASKNARKMADALLADNENDYELTERVVDYMNTYVDAVIQQCAGLKPGDLEEVFFEIRKELKRQEKNLTILIEDITSFTGVNLALLNSLNARHDGMNEEEGLCRISSVVGTTTAYFNDFRENYQHRVTKFLEIPNNAFGEKAENLYEFIGKYLNVMSLNADVVENWARNGALDEDYPIHECVEGKYWDYYELNDGKRLNLFPFSQNAITNLYVCILEEAHRTPRFLLRDIVERVLKDYIYNRDGFPGFQIERPDYIPGWNPVEHRNHLNRNVMNPDESRRLQNFIRIWGNANVYETVDTETNETYLGGINKKCYRDFNLPPISGLKISRNETQDVKNYSENYGKKEESSKIANTGQRKPSMNNSYAEISNQAQIDYQLGLDTLDVWIAGGYLNVGATTKDVINITRARDEINVFLFSAINWQQEGVSLDNVNKNRLLYKKGLVGFERQKRGLDQFLIILPADNNTQSLLEAFLAYVTLGRKGDNRYSWDFPGAMRHLYNVQLWLEKNKKKIVDAVNHNGEDEVDYYEYAIAFEIIRQILFGVYEGKTYEGISPKAVIAPNLTKKSDNSHSLKWNNLMDIMLKNENKIKDTITQYFNIIQGGKTSSMVFLRYNEYIAAIRDVKKKKLSLELDTTDTVGERQEIKDIWGKIAVRIEEVAESERQKASEKLRELKTYVNIDDFDEEELIDLLDKIRAFYSGAETAHFNIQADSGLINYVKKNAKGICYAIEEVDKAIEVTEPLTVLLKFSSDPLAKMNKLLALCLKLAKDIKYINNDVAKRYEKINVVDEGHEKAKYVNERQQIMSAKDTVIEWEVKECF
jgi:hypothetical protein